MASLQKTLLKHVHIHFSFHIAVDATQNSALISRACGRAHLVNINRERDGRSGGTIVQDYIPREAEQNYGERVSNPFGAIFASTGDLVVYGTVSGRILVWDRVRGCVTYELVLGQGEPFSLHFLRLLMCTI